MSRIKRSIHVAGLEHKAPIPLGARVGGLVCSSGISGKDDSARDPINIEWLACFPDPHDRAARHMITYDLQNQMLLQLELIAFVPPSGHLAPPPPPSTALTYWAQNRDLLSSK